MATPRVNIDQAATTADRNRLNGYREIRELGASLPPGGGDAARSSPTVAPTPRTPPAVPKYITTTIKVAAPAKKPEPPEPVLPPPKGGMAGVGSVGGAAAQPKAAPQPHTPTAKMTELRTKTVQRINPAWVEQQKAAKAPVAVTARGGSGASARPVAKVEAPKPTGLGQGGNPLAGKKVMTQNHGEQMAGQRLNGSNRGLTVTGDTWFDSVRGI